MNEVDKLLMLDLAKDAIKAHLSGGEPDVSRVKHLSEPKIAFVGLFKRGQFRGGMGVMEPKPAYEAVLEAAEKAAFNDPRYEPLKEDELKFLKIRISLMDELIPLKGEPTSFDEQIEIGTEGLIMEGVGRALLLPHIAKEKGYTSIQFLNALAQAAGLSFNGWKDKRNKVYKFKAITFSE